MISLSPPQVCFLAFLGAQVRLDREVMVKSARVIVDCRQFHIIITLFSRLSSPS